MEMVGMGCSTEGDFEVGASETPSTAKDNLIEPQRSKKKTIEPRFNDVVRVVLRDLGDLAG